MVYAEVYTHVLRHGNSVKNRDGEIENPLMRLYNLELSILTDDNHNIILAPDWKDMGMRPFKITLDRIEARMLRDNLNKILGK